MTNSINKRIIIFGGDGFCGWPTSLYLSRNGYDVTIVDNLSRRNIDNELECESLTCIRPIGERIRTWNDITGNSIDFINFDMAKEYDRLVEVLKEIKPKAVVHFAEQRAAPYSMKSPKHKRYTVDNNLRATHNVLCAIVESGVDIHLVHLGTMGVYGYETTGLAIPEGYLPVKVEREDGTLVDLEIIYPPGPGSVYHTTKTQDALFFYFYNRKNQIWFLCR